jgi:hypothetical protein
MGSNLFGAHLKIGKLQQTNAIFRQSDFAVEFVDIRAYKVAAGPHQLAEEVFEVSGIGTRLAMQDRPRP